MNGYHTRQRNQLMAFFAAHADAPYTLDEVLHQLHDVQGASAPSRSTVYRTAAELEAEHMLRRVYLPHQRRSAYQYVNPQRCMAHLHVRCSRCHALMHLDATVSDAVAQLLASSAHVSLDIGNTILQGCCAACSQPSFPPSTQGGGDHDPE